LIDLLKKCDLKIDQLEDLVNLFDFEVKHRFTFLKKWDWIFEDGDVLNRKFS